MRKNKVARSLRKPTKGTLPKRKPKDPKVRAAKRLEQAERLAAKYDRFPPTSVEHVTRCANNLARIKALKAWEWPKANAGAYAVIPEDAVIEVVVTNATDGAVYA